MITEAQEREWNEYERRNPGVAHPDRVKHRIDSGRELQSRDYTAGTTRFRHDDDALSFGQRARLARQRNGGM
jgi:hypothetical protein